MTSAQAATVLRVGQREVQRLSRQGDLTVVGTVGQSLLLDPVSVHRHAGQQITVGRPWSAGAVWAAIEMLTGGRADWLDATRRRRLRAKLAHLEVDDLIWLARRRADEHRYHGWRGQLAQLRENVVATGTSDDPERLEELFELSPDPESVQGYVAAGDLDHLVQRFELTSAPAGNVTLHVTTVVAAVTVQSSAVLVALDLATSIDPRERSAGRRVLVEHLGRFHP